MNQELRTRLAVALTTLPKLHSTLIRILVYCVLTHTDGFTYSPRGLAALMNLPRRTIQDQVPELLRLKVWTLKEKHETPNGRELFLYSFHPEAVSTLIESIGRISPNPIGRISPCTKNNNVQSNVLRNRIVQESIGRISPNALPKYQLPPDVQKRLDEYKLGFPVGKSINGWSSK